ncbi:MAG: hypothetical protein O3A01_05265 [bacterium]|nr:hypothetical protein [bacterium]
MEFSGKEKASTVLALVGDQTAKPIVSGLPKSYQTVLQERLDSAIPTDPDVIQAIIHEAFTHMERIQPGITNVVVPTKQSDFIDDLSMPVPNDTDAEEVDLFSDDLEIEQNELPIPEPEPMPEASAPEPVFDVVKVAEELQQQRPQVLAFLLSRMHDDLRLQIEAQLPQGQVELARALSVEQLPISEKVFSKIYKTLLN